MNFGKSRKCPLMAKSPTTNAPLHSCVSLQSPPTFTKLTQKCGNRSHLEPEQQTTLSVQLTHSTIRVIPITTGESLASHGVPAGTATMSTGGPSTRRSRSVARPTNWPDFPRFGRPHGPIDHESRGSSGTPCRRWWRSAAQPLLTRQTPGTRPSHGRTPWPAGACPEPACWGSLAVNRDPSGRGTASGPAVAWKHTGSAMRERRWRATADLAGRRLGGCGKRI